MLRLLCSLVWLSSHSEGFAPTRAFVRNTALQVDQGVDLSLLGNFESDAEFLKRSVKKWLDDEFHHRNHLHNPYVNPHNNHQNNLH
jgi:hypothetical protein